MKIGIDARFFGLRNKGLGRYTQKLIEALEEIDRENQYVVFLRQENWDLYQPKFPNFKKTMADYPWYSLAEQILFPFKLYWARVDLMHFPHFNVPIFYFGRFVVTIHDLILRQFPTRRASTLSLIKYWVKNLSYRFVIYFAIKKAKKIIAVSNHTKEDILRFYKVKQGKIDVIYEGSPAVIANPSKVSRDKFQKPYLLYVGNAYPHKNLERLIEAFQILADRADELRLIFVGEIDYFYHRLKDFAADKFPTIKHKIIFADFVEDKNLMPFFQNASLYVFPSLCEGFGLPPLEAMACGVPVVSSGASCLPEILGEAAVYFDALDPQDIAQKIRQVLEDESLRQKLVLAGYEQIKKYSWEKMGKEISGIYEDLK
ncbi:MAG: glycosyltransferase family 4 protein [Candidatus Portnoybacteria bacterium]|nr:glycosyltransferase family 4 protein [Candidatus Portnoybacteria bacterium]